MAVDGVAHRERLALCALFTRLGPDAPTLCEGWAPRPLCAHRLAGALYPLSVPAIAVRLLHPDGRHMSVLPGLSGRLDVAGPPDEIFLFAFNRREAARVEVTGDARGLQRLSGSRLGV